MLFILKYNIANTFNSNPYDVIEFLIMYYNDQLRKWLFSELKNLYSRSSLYSIKIFFFFTSLKLKLGISQFVTYLNLKSQKAQPQLPEVTVLHLGYQKISKPELEVWICANVSWKNFPYAFHMTKVGYSNLKVLCLCSFEVRF